MTRLLVRAPNWLGDAVMAIPAMAAIRAASADAHLTVAAPASVAALFQENTPVRQDAVLTLPEKSRDVSTALAAGSFQTSILFPNSFRSAWQMKRAGIPERWGYGAASRGWLLTRAIARPSGKGPLHQADYYRELVRALEIDCEDAAPSLAPSESSLAAADNLLRRHRWPAGTRFVAVMPGAAYGEAKQWPASRMAEVVARLVRECGVRCLVLGAAGDRSAARAIESSLRERAPQEAPFVLDLTGQTSLGVLVALLSRAATCVSNDSGGMHVAAALGRPVVAVFGPTDERTTRPIGNHAVITESVFCRPCMLRDCPIDHRCMKRIDAGRVFDAAASRLAASGA
ncbi:MAG TPA: lipopolysaccharide heptosyltransferase II [Vicinamibacterales bacterium]|nr:lipopolysaccharide heptosyltransferase II [Vicinamibacterales bacterium]